MADEGGVEQGSLLQLPSQRQVQFQEPFAPGVTGEGFQGAQRFVVGAAVVNTPSADQQTPFTFQLRDA